MATQLLHDPLFAAPATEWGQATVTGNPPATTTYNSARFVVTSGVAAVTSSKYGGFYYDILGKATGVTSPGSTVTVSAKVAHTTVPVRVGLYQGTTLLGDVVQAAATGAVREALTFNVTVPTTDALTLRVWAPTADPYAGTAATLSVEAPSVLLQDPPPAPDPEPEPEPDPEPEPVTSAALVAALAPRLAAHIGASESTTSAAVLPVVIEFVKGYTRDRGFGDGYSPEAPLQAVIISAASRLATNPEQVFQFQAGDYSERPAILNGFTLAELAVLNRYRRRSW